MLKLYQRETCPFCKPVREYLTKMNVSYININVVKDRSQRKELIELTGGPYIPAIIDGDIVISGKLEDNTHIMEYLQKKFEA